MTRLEPISRSHIDLAHKYASDRRISDTSNVPHPYTREMADDWFEAVLSRQKSGKSKVFAIYFEEFFAGIISLNSIDLELKKAEIDYWVAVKYQGKGVATSAIAKIVSCGEKNHALKVFHSGCLARNVASLKAQSKNGFRIVENTKLKNGKFAGEDYVISRYEIA